MKKVIVFLADGFEEIEALAAVDILRRANIKTDICSVGGEYVRGAHDITVKADFKICNIKDEYDMIVLPGGMPGTLNLMENKQLINLIKEYNKRNKFIAAICAAPKVLNKADVLSGKKVTSYPGALDNMSGFIYSEDQVVTNGNIITSRGPGTAVEFALKIVNILQGKDVEMSLREDLILK
ncbi:MAG: DJ-1 family glyoxalase III [Clostridiaceae bacterium]